MTCFQFLGITPNFPEYQYTCSHVEHYILVFHRYYHSLAVETPDEHDLKNLALDCVILETTLAEKFTNGTLAWRPQSLVSIITNEWQRGTRVTCIDLRGHSIRITAIVHQITVHYNDVIMGAIASQITSIPVVYSTVYSDTENRKHQSSESLAFVGGIHRGPVNSPHKSPVTRKMFPFDDVIMNWLVTDKHRHNILLNQWSWVLQL